MHEQSAVSPSEGPVFYIKDSSATRVVLESEEIFPSHTEAMLLICELDAAESPVDVEVDAEPRRLPVPDIHCQLPTLSELLEL